MKHRYRPQTPHFYFVTPTKGKICTKPQQRSQKDENIQRQHWSLDKIFLTTGPILC